MLSTGLIAFAALCWLGLLFGVALLGERKPKLFERQIGRASCRERVCNGV